MENMAKAISPEEHELYLRTVELHSRNNTINHEEDERSVLEIVSAGLKKLPNFDLGHF